MPKERTLLPRYLTKGIATTAVDFAYDAAIGRPYVVGKDIDHKMCHVVVVVSAVLKTGLQTDINPSELKVSSLDQTVPYVLYRRSFGDEEQSWPYPFPFIAMSKAIQLWQDRNDGGTDIKPHLLFQSDTHFWGGVKREGIVVACSGFEPHRDRMLAGVAADLMIGFARDAWEADRKRDAEECFVGAT